MNRIILILFCILYTINLSCQKSTFENINDAASSILGIFSKKKNTGVDTIANNFQQGGMVTKKLSESNPKVGLCRELCVRSYNKKNARIELKSKQTLETTTIAVMSKDKSCVFDFDVGIYILQIIIDDKLVKSSEIKIFNELELIEIPDI